MADYLFGNREATSNGNPVLVNYLECIYQSGNFVRFLEYFSARTGFVWNEIGYRFPDLTEYDAEYYFVGVRVWVGVSRITLAEVDFVEQVGKACKNYCSKHQDNVSLVNALLEKIQNNCRKIEITSGFEMLKRDTSKASISTIDKAVYEPCFHHLIDWGVVLLEVAGMQGIDERLSPSLVKDFAYHELEEVSIDDPLLEFIVDLAANSGYNSLDLCERIEKICQAKGINLEKSRQKWLLILLDSILSDIDSDPLYGLIKLAKFWAAWGWPPGSSALMQHDNKISSQDYHSPANFFHVVANHREWLEAEIAACR